MLPRFVALFALAAGASLAHAGEVQVAVASNFTVPMKAIAARFEHDTGHKVLAAYGATGKFYAQVRNGAPFDVLLAADAATPARLDADKASVPGTRFTYAIGKLVLWSAQPGRVDARGDVLARGGFQHLALANPALAPYGAAAAQVLRQRQLYEPLASKFVFGENIAQTHQYVASGAAQLGFVAMSQVFVDGKLSSGSAWIVPEHLYSPLRQDAVLLARAQGNPAAAAFLRFLRSDTAGAIVRAYGYGR